MICTLNFNQLSKFLNLAYTTLLRKKLITQGKLVKLYPSSPTLISA